MQSSKYHTNKNAITLSNQTWQKETDLNIQPFQHNQKWPTKKFSFQYQNSINRKGDAKTLIDQRGDIVW